MYRTRLTLSTLHRAHTPTPHSRAIEMPRIHHRIRRLGSHPAVCEWAIVRASRADAAAPLATFLDGLPVACYLLQGKSLPREGAHGQRQSCRSVSRVARQALCMEAAGQAAVERWYRLRARAASTCLRASPVRGEFRPEPDLALQTRSGRAQQLPHGHTVSTWAHMGSLEPGAKARAVPSRCAGCVGRRCGQARAPPAG